MIYKTNFDIDKKNYEPSKFFVFWQKLIMPKFMQELLNTKIEKYP